MRRVCAVLVALGLSSGCSNEDGASQESSGADTTAGDTVIEPTTTVGSSSTTTNTADESTGSSSSGGAVASSSSTGEPPPVGPPVCTRDCELPSDCCRPDDPDCPSAIYPGNFGCVDGACVPPACRNDAECDAVFPGTTCQTIFGHVQCVTLCDDETPCEGSDTACMGQTDDGRGYCRESCVDAGVLACPTTTCDEVTGLCLCELGDCPTGEICAPL